MPPIDTDAPVSAFVKLPRGALARLSRDPDMRRLVARVGPFRLEVGRARNHLGALVRSIVYQQLSGKAAGTIHGRLRDACAPGFPDAHVLLSKTDEELRACGLSRQKVASLRDLCERVASRSLRLDRLDGLADAQIVEELTLVRGIGAWSAQMFLVFHLGRLDVWPSSDLGVRKALQRLSGARELPTVKEVDARGEIYRPYRTVASWYLWRLLDGDAGDW